MSRIVGRKPKASTNKMTPGHSPLPPGCTRDASQTPLGVLISTALTVGSCEAGDPPNALLEAAAVTPAANDAAVN
jgi:hypothetical protein